MFLEFKISYSKNSKYLKTICFSSLSLSIQLLLSSVISNFESNQLNKQTNVSRSLFSCDNFNNKFNLYIFILR